MSDPLSAPMTASELIALLEELLDVTVDYESASGVEYEPAKKRYWDKKNAMIAALRTAAAPLPRGADREAVARIICHYSTGPSDFNSCCPDPMGDKRCQRQADAILALALPARESEMTAAEMREACATEAGYWGEPIETSIATVIRHLPLSLTSNDGNALDKSGGAE